MNAHLIVIGPRIVAETALCTFAWPIVPVYDFWMEVLSRMFSVPITPLVPEEFTE